VAGLNPNYGLLRKEHLVSAPSRAALGGPSAPLSRYETHEDKYLKAALWMATWTKRIVA